LKWGKGEGFLKEKRPIREEKKEGGREWKIVSVPSRVNTGQNGGGKKKRLRGLICQEGRSMGIFSKVSIGNKGRKTSIGKREESHRPKEKGR